MVYQINWSKNLTYYDFNKQILEQNGGSTSRLTNQVCKSIHNEFFKYDLPRMILLGSTCVGIIGGFIGIFTCIIAVGPCTNLTFNLLMAGMSTSVAVGLVSGIICVSTDITNLQIKKLKTTHVPEEKFKIIMDQEFPQNMPKESVAGA